MTQEKSFLDFNRLAGFQDEPFHLGCSNMNVYSWRTILWT